MGVELHSFAERPDLRDHPTRSDLFDVWPEFLLHDPVVNRHMWGLRTDYAEFQTIAYDTEADAIVGEGDTVPVRWSGEPEPKASTGRCGSGSRRAASRRRSAPSR